MNNQTYLGTNLWELPTIEIGCGMYECGGSDNPMGNLYYSQLHLTRGTPIVNAPNITVGPFHNIQPYLYWACSGEASRPSAIPEAPPTTSSGASRTAADSRAPTSSATGST
jgi:hypothetical protein